LRHRIAFNNGVTEGGSANPKTEGILMKSIRFLAIPGAIAGLALALLFVPSSNAECGTLVKPTIAPANWNANLDKEHLLRASLVGTGDQESESQAAASIVGQWHVHFISDGVSSGIPGGIPKGAEVDAGYSQWHSDGTETTNSGQRAPNTGNICFGVWEKVGTNKYLLNHFGISWDPTKGPVGPTGPAGELIGPARLQAAITLDPSGEHFTGKFTIDQYDEAGNHLMHLEGTLNADRMTVNTPESSIF
jgi:hypothetical protein